MVACQKGAVSVARSGGGTVLVQGAAPRRQGDRVTARADSGAILYFSDGRIQRLSANETAQVTGRRSTKSAAAAAFKSLLARLRDSFAAGGTRRPLGTRGDEDAVPTILAPRNTHILLDGIVFEWQAVPHAKRYKIALLGTDGVSVLWQAMTEATELGYPQEAPDLAPGQVYRWEVSAVMPGGQAPASDLAWFAVLPAAGAQRVRDAAKQLAEQLGESAALPLAALYADHRLFGLAIEALEQECSLTRAGPAVYAVLGELYAKTGGFAAAARSWEAAGPPPTEQERVLWAEPGG